MKTNDFNYELPEELIAQHPLEERTSSRLLVLDKTYKKINHGKFVDILEHMNPGDGIVLNDSRVLPARLFGNRPGKEESLEVLLLKRTEKNIWECLVRPGKKMKAGGKIEFGEGILKGTVLKIGEDGTRFIDFTFKGIFEEILDKLGEMPLPPYITEKLEDGERYQTVYSKNPGSAAAPTAGLHFDNELLGRIQEKGIEIVYLTLHVGLGTFRPVKVEDINDHIMHSEYYQLSEEAAETINRIKQTGGKIISVGTTSTRTLETIADENGIVSGGSGWTDIFIYPGYRFKLVDGLITNFHLPESTLMMLVSAFASKDLIMEAYQEAINNRYRFFSFGDSMFIK
ncbi:tRNA preQ1(34) S-adenosylmethionine ribosyltransferase-isomerase QueA [Gudongella sp. DL1XJH-153]|uniref:tRNA preQ1(34) S-adenosylmethionine ribosyltransferase-isomerase QueA n=1 Tax=Gudongella sp. DL1XJH-153 TaxID=3409804 RepID=UPI003BB7F7AF